MVSQNYKTYSRIVRWPDLKMVREKTPHQKWHVDRPSLSCPGVSRIHVTNRQQNIFKIWISQSLDDDKLHMLDSGGNEIPEREICKACAVRVMRLVRWRGSDYGDLETEQHESRDETEEREFRAKGLLE